MEWSPLLIKGQLSCNNSNKNNNNSDDDDENKKLLQLGPVRE